MHDYENWKHTDVQVWFNTSIGYGYDGKHTVEDLYQMFAQRMRLENAQSTLKLMKELGP